MPIHGARWLVPAVVVGLISTGSITLHAQTNARAEVRLTVRTPHASTFVVALDELHVDRAASDAVDAPPAASAASRLASGPRRSTLERIPRTRSLPELASAAREAEDAMPGARADLVLYEAGVPRSAKTRRLLTREVAVVLNPGADVGAALAGIATRGVRSTRGVPHALVVECESPLAALDAAKILSQRGDVRAAYPLLRRLEFLR